MLRSFVGEPNCLLIAIKLIIYIAIVISESNHSQISLRSSMLRKSAQLSKTYRTSCLEILIASILVLIVEFLLCLHVTTTWERKLWEKYCIFSLTSHTIGLLFLFVVFDDLILNYLYGIFGFTIAPPLTCLLLVLLLAHLSKK
ncbi:hypothetical protein FBUS_10571 [Fasciolopsis buskii]|uniref:Uncharacterized protein n=1 Tax=Fasciolopsis buskii TaxID=27845 RepID=A0A8E0RLQ8_9TREM|nr:hypothetical protein FBUS_10571 [Fasciolopsis buski]